MIHGSCCYQQYFSTGERTRGASLALVCCIDGNDGVSCSIDLQYHLSFPSPLPFCRTTRRQVDSVFHDFIARFPSAEETAAADVSDVLNIVTPLGIKHRRSNGIIRFSREYVQLIKSKSSRHFIGDSSKTDNERESEERGAIDRELEDDEILGLFGCGRYALCAYKIFIRGDLDCAVHDHALHYYVDYKRAVSN